MNKQYILRPTRVHVLPEGEALYSHRGFVVEINADGNGLVIRQQLNDNIIIVGSEDEWNAISAAVADIVSEIRKWEGKDVPNNQMAEAFSQLQNSIEKAATMAGDSLAITGAGSEF